MKFHKNPPDESGCDTSLLVTTNGLSPDGSSPTLAQTNTKKYNNKKILQNNKITQNKKITQNNKITTKQ
jgi:hypothetical protein